MGMIAWPNNSFRVRTARWERYEQDVTFRGPFGVQTATLMPALWKVSLNFDLLDEKEAGAYQALVLGMEGAKNQLALYNHGRPTPRGTFLGVTGTTTMSGAVTVGAYTISFTNSTYANKTLLAGDFIGIQEGSLSNTKQLVMVTSNFTADATGKITVNIMPPARNAISIGSAVTLQYPTALFRLQGPVGWNYEQNTVDGLSLDLLEDPRA